MHADDCCQVVGRGNGKQSVRYKQAKALLNCPRAHHKYIEEYGIHKFILQCQHVTEESNRLKDALDEQTKRMSVRNSNASTDQFERNEKKQRYWTEKRDMHTDRDAKWKTLQNFMHTSGYEINLFDKPKVIDAKMALEDKKRAKRYDGDLKIQD